MKGEILPGWKLFYTSAADANSDRYHVWQKSDLKKTTTSRTKNVDYSDYQFTS